MVLIENPFSCLDNIYKGLQIDKQGVISDYLNDLEKAGFVSRDYAFNFKTQKTSKHSVFRISDNFIRFYLKYIEPNMALIHQDRFEHTSLSTLKNWETIAGLQFENLIINNKSLINPRNSPGIFSFLSMSTRNSLTLSSFLKQILLGFKPPQTWANKLPK